MELLVAIIVLWLAYKFLKAVVQGIGVFMIAMIALTIFGLAVLG